MSAPYKVVDTKSLKGRIAVAAVIVAAVLFGWFSVRWQIGNMLGSLTQPNAPNAAAIADWSHDLSPNDPITNWLQAVIYKDEFTPESLSKAVASFEEMVRSAPYDHRAWIELGRGLEQAEQFERAERAFLRAVELAPNYSYAHWHLGNFYLRQNREAEAIERFRSAAEASPEYREQVFAIVWDYFESDPKKLEELAGQKPEMRAGLAKFYAAKDLAPESLRIWNSLSAEEKQAYQDVARVVTQALYEKRYFRSAVQFVNQLALEPQARLETVQNGGFEGAMLEDAQKVFFNWKIVKLDKVEVRTDAAKKREGNRSLRVNFSGFSGIEVKNVWQVVAVRSSARYRLSFFVRTENLKSAGTPLFEIVNANDDKLIVTSQPFPAETNDWSEIRVDFATPANAEGVLIRLDRAYCGDSCPIVGSVFIDEVKIEKL